MPATQRSSLLQWLAQSPPGEWAVNQIRALLIGALKQGPIPQHIAFVMDGNRRFARSHQMETVEGHNLGFEALARILEICYKTGVKVVTIYAFSIENFKRSKYEVNALMEMAKLKLVQLAQHGELLDRYGASIRILGQRNLVNPDVLAAIDQAVNLTKDNKNATLNVCFPYTSRDEITTAIRNTVSDYTQPTENDTLQRPFSETHITHNIQSQKLSTIEEDSSRSHSPSPDRFDENSASTTSISSSATLNHQSSPDSVYTPTHDIPDQASLPDPENITAETLSNHMFTAGNPPLDLLIRTSGVERLSDFMLWQCHENTSIKFLDCLWPEFDLWQFLPVLVEWQYWRGQNSHFLEKEDTHRRGIKVA